MKRGICTDCGKTARSNLSYFCHKCLEKQALKKAVNE